MPVWPRSHSIRSNWPRRLEATGFPTQQAVDMAEVPFDTLKLAPPSGSDGLPDAAGGRYGRGDRRGAVATRHQSRSRRIAAATKADIAATKADIAALQAATRADIAVLQGRHKG